MDLCDGKEVIPPYLSNVVRVVSSLIFVTAVSKLYCKYGHYIQEINTVMISVWLGHCFMMVLKPILKFTGHKRNLIEIILSFVTKKVSMLFFVMSMLRLKKL